MPNEAMDSSVHTDAVLAYSDMDEAGAEGHPGGPSVPAEQG